MWTFPLSFFSWHFWRVQLFCRPSLNLSLSEVLSWLLGQGYLFLSGIPLKWNFNLSVSCKEAQDVYLFYYDKLYRLVTMVSARSLHYKVPLFPFVICGKIHWDFAITLFLLKISCTCFSIQRFLPESVFLMMIEKSWFFLTLLFLLH